MLNSSVARKLFMALSGLFLIIFLTQHLLINLTPLISSIFLIQFLTMGTNPIVQYILQPHNSGVFFHFVMGFVLEIKKSRARVKSYAKANLGVGSFASRNMIISGVVILSFLFIHFYDFWVHETNVKYVQGDMSGKT